MSSSGNHTNAERDPDRMESLLSEATGLFACRGFDAISMDEVAQAAGCTRRTLYRYFPSKDELFWRCFGRAVGFILERQRLTTRVCESAGLPARDYLAALARAYLDSAVEKPAEFRLVMEGRERAAASGASGLSLSETSLSWLIAFQRQAQEGVAELGKRLEARDECPRGTGARRAGQFLVALLGTVEFHM